MLPALASLIALQELDTASDTARRRMMELPAAEQRLDDLLSASAEAVQRVKARLAANQDARRDLEKRVAVVDTRLARFDDHKAAVKTNQEYTALLHEIELARADKDALEEQILRLMEDADAIAGDLAQAERAQAETRTATDSDRAALRAEHAALEAEMTRLADQRQRQSAEIDKTLLARYDQLLKQRKMVAVAALNGDICGACHVRLRPAVMQHVRRNADIVTCDSCQRILYAPPLSQTQEAESSPSHS